MATLGYWNSRRLPSEGKRPARGITLYFWIWREHFWQMVTLNLYVLLFSLPIVTAFPALSAMNRVLYRMIDDEPQMIWQEFKEAFLKNWKRAVLAGIPLIVVEAILIFVGGFGWECVRSGWFVLTAWICQILLVMVGGYVLAMVSYLELPLAACFKNALLFQMICIRRNLLMVLLLLALTLVFAALYPLSILLLLLFVPTLGYAMAYCTHWGISQFAAQT